MKKYIETLIFGERTKRAEKLKAPTFTTVYPDNKPPYHKWCKMYRVSLMVPKKYA